MVGKKAGVGGQADRGRIPVRIFWNASSTLLASRAEVSIKERWFSPGNKGVSMPGLSLGPGG